MSQTNGSSEPTMEEILASIRNIIAQDPAKAEGAAATPAQPEPAAKAEPTGTATTGTEGGRTEAKAEPAQPAARAAGPDFGSLRPAADRTPSFGPGASDGPKLPFSRPNEPTPVPAAKTAEPEPVASNEGSAADEQAPADDFSDLFEEPIPTLSITPSPFAGAKPATTADMASTEPAAAPEPTAAPVTTAPEPEAEAGKPQPKEMPLSESVAAALGRPAPQADKAPPVASPERKEGSGFDFGTFRAPRFEPGKTGAVPPAGTSPEIKPAAPFNCTSDAPREAEGAAAAEAAEPKSAEANSDAGANAPVAREKASPTVIAAMTPPAAPPEAKPATEAAEKSTSDDPAPAAEAEAAKSAAALKDSAAALKGSNVGFLAKAPRPIDPPGDTKPVSRLEPIARMEKAAATPSKPSSGDEKPAAASWSAGASDLSAKQESHGKSEDAKPAPPHGELKAASSLFESPPDSSPESAPVTEQDSTPAPEAADAKPAPFAKPAPYAGSPATSQAALQPTAPSTEGLSVSNIIVSSEGGRVKTLEDTVAELLRPLLREWLENNMPRIVESALRLEVAESVKKQLEGPSRSKPNGHG